MSFEQLSYKDNTNINIFFNNLTVKSYWKIYPLFFPRATVNVICGSAMSIFVTTFNKTIDFQKIMGRITTCLRDYNLCNPFLTL